VRFYARARRGIRESLVGASHFVHMGGQWRISIPLL
jgi:hypothetical protein